PARLRTSLATTAKPRPCSPARAASTAALSASRLVWKAMSSMTPMMSAIFFDASLIPAMAATAWLTTEPPFSAWSRAARASWLACAALSAFCLTVVVISSMEEAVSSREADCSSVRRERLVLPAEISSAERFTSVAVDLMPRTMPAMLSRSELIPSAMVRSSGLSMRVSSRRERSPCEAALITARVSSMMFLVTLILNSLFCSGGTGGERFLALDAGGKGEIPADEAVDVEEHDHALGDRYEATDVVGGGARAELGCRFHFGRVDVHDIRDAVHDDTEVTASGRCVDGHHDDHGDRRVLDAVESEAHPQIDDRNDRAAQVQHAEYVCRRVRDLGHRRPAADFLDAQNVDPVGLLAEHESQNLVGSAAGALLWVDRLSGHDCDASPALPWSSRCRPHGGRADEPRNIENECHRAVAEDRRARDALDVPVVGFQRFDDHLLLSEQVIDEQTDPPPVAFGY